MRKRIRDNADLRKMRYRQAGKQAQKRLKTARELLAKNDRTRFYEEIERAIWTYLSDRLSIPTAELNKENVRQLLEQKNVSAETIEHLNDLLTRTELARYAPQQSDHDMQDIYDETATLLDELKI